MTRTLVLRSDLQRVESARRDGREPDLKDLPVIDMAAGSKKLPAGFEYADYLDYAEYSYT